MKICIDAGHGGEFNNAIAYDGTLEKTENLTNALALKAEMLRRGHDVVMTRERDIDLVTKHNASYTARLSEDLNARVAIAENAAADCFISLHENDYDDPSANGVECVHGTNASQKSKQWANDCLTRLVNASGLRRREVLSQSITVLKKTSMPSMLVEMCFMSNKIDMDTVRAKRAAMITAIADSCEAMFGARSAETSDPYAYKLSVDAPLYRYVGDGTEGTNVTLVAYPIVQEPSGVFAKVKDENGKEYLVEWKYLSKK